MARGEEVVVRDEDLAPAGALVRAQLQGELAAVHGVAHDLDGAEVAGYSQAGPVHAAQRTQAAALLSTLD